jgi:hypothetical protein
MNKPYFLSKIIISIFFMLISAQVLAGSYQLPITRDGKTNTCVAYNSWMGEYPSPVINIKANRKGLTSIKAYRSLRKLNQAVSCTIKNGLYHPWSKTANSVITYYTIIGLVSYKAIKPTKLEKNYIRKGDVIDNVHALSEGYCAGRLKSFSSKKEIEFNCADIDKPAFKNIKDGRDIFEQWLYVKCKQGYKAFVKDTNLLKQTGSLHGQIKGYEEISP